MTNRRGTNIQGRLLLYFTENAGKLLHLPDIMKALGETDRDRVMAAISRLRARKELGTLEIVVRGTTYRFHPAPPKAQLDAKPSRRNSTRAVAAELAEAIGQTAGVEPTLSGDLEASCCSIGDPDCNCLISPLEKAPHHARTDGYHKGFTNRKPSGAFTTQERLFQEVGAIKNGRPLLRCEDGTFWVAEQI